MYANPEIIEEQEISMNELADELKNIKKRDGELNYRADKTEDYLNHVLTLKSKQYKDLRKEIEELNIPRLRNPHICKILDILPKTQEEVKQIASSFSITVTNDNATKIAKTVSEFLKE